jgi:hypothetical protein
LTVADGANFLRQTTMTSFGRETRWLFSDRYLRKIAPIEVERLIMLHATIVLYYPQLTKFEAAAD